MQEKRNMKFMRKQAKWHDEEIENYFFHDEKEEQSTTVRIMMKHWVAASFLFANESYIDTYTYERLFRGRRNYILNLSITQWSKSNKQILLLQFHSKNQESWILNNEIARQLSTCTWIKMSSFLESFFIPANLRLPLLYLYFFWNRT